MSKIEELERIIQEYKNLKAIEQEHQKINGELRKENKQLEEQTDRLLDEQEEREKYTHGLEEKLKNSIPKVKVEGKIEELEKEKDKEYKAGDFTRIHEHEQDLELCIKVLKELLESEEN